MEITRIATGSDSAWGYWFPADGDGPVILFLPALGMPAGFYGKLGAALAAQGLATFCYEQPGHGEHPLRAARNVDYGLLRWVRDDLPAVIDWLADQAPGRRLVLAGHSLGAHASACLLAAHPGLCDRFISIAAAIPYPAHFSRSVGWQIRLLAGAIIPASGALLGYYPGKRIGFGGNEARTLMREWRAMARSNLYRVEGLELDVEAVLADLPIEILQVRFADDAFAPAQGADSVTDKFARAHVSRRAVSAAELGEAADHFRWARQGEVVAALVADWLGALPSSAE